METPIESIGYMPGSDQDPRLSALRLITLQAQAAAKLLKLLGKPDAWCPMGKAVDAHGKQINPLSPNATHWSLLGALYRCRLTQAEVMALRVFFEAGHGWTIESISSSMPRYELVTVLKKMCKDRGKKIQALEDYTNLVQTYQQKKLATYLQTLKCNPSNTSSAPANETPTSDTGAQSETTSIPAAPESQLSDAVNGHA